MKLQLAVLTVCIAMVVPDFAFGQVKYTPDHPEVRAMADKCADYLNRTGGSGTLEYRAVMALAIVEHGKRYEGSAPRTNPVVSGTCDAIASGIGGVTDRDEIYFSCVAAILLAETNAAKYKDEIRAIVEHIESRIEANGSFTYRSQRGSTADMSQTQFAALALFVAKHHGFNVDAEKAKRMLLWVLASQNKQDGGWVYKYQTSGDANDPGRPTTGNTLSMQAAGIGTAYLLADLLQLNKRATVMSSAIAGKDNGLPRTVSVYVKPIEGQPSGKKREGPLVSFDRGIFNNGTRSGNQNLEVRYTPDGPVWPMYYLYAVERYAYFREQTEGNLGDGKLSTWYDQAVDFLKTQSDPSGGFKKNRREEIALTTAFGLLVLVRSSEIITQPTANSITFGGRGFGNQSNTMLRENSNGTLAMVDTERDLDQMIDMLGDTTSNEELQALSASLKKQIVEFRNKDEKSRGRIKAFLKSMVAARNYYRRLIAVRFLAGEQDMDNVPALIYALGDPDLRICVEAHDGLRLISRKIDSIKISGTSRTNSQRDPGILKSTEKSLCRAEFDSVKQKWTDWFLKIRPDAELLD